MTYQEALDYIHSVYWRGSKLGLARITELLERMGNPQRQLRFIHVAGTNGKGSTCAFLAAILEKAGYRTGLYISPYIERFNERIQVNRQPIPDRELAEITGYVRSFAEQMAALPTEFEIVCAIAFEYFTRCRCDMVVLEVGLGGRLDATNVIPAPLAAVMAPISFDHTAILGNTLGEIAAEKAGIIKPGTSVVSSEQDPSVVAVLTQRCQQTGSALTFADFSQIRPLSYSLDGQAFHYRSFADLRIRLLGEHQLRNAALAIEAAGIVSAHGLRVDDRSIYEGLADTFWPGRFEVLRRDMPVIVDGGHNPQGVRACVEAVKRHLPRRELVVLVGVLADKEVADMLEILNEIACAFVATRPPGDRALDAPELAGKLSAFGKPVLIEPDLGAACSAAERLARAQSAALLAVGSLYMTGSIRQYFLT